jgi:CSLREA domain-containing protein
MKSIASLLPRYDVPVLRAILAVTFIVSSSAAAPPISPRNQSAAYLEIEAPNQVAVGDLIEVTLRVKHAVDIAGYETAVLFDTTAAEFAGLRQRQNDVKKIGRGVSPLAAVDLPNGVAIGLYSCPVDDCVSRQRATKAQVQGAQGTVKLASLFLVANLPGALEIKLDAAKFVDAAGNPVTVEIPRSSVIVQVGASGQGPSYAAPAAMWTLQPARQPLAESPALTQRSPFDLTGDRIVTNADAMEVSIEWELLRLRQAACGDLPDPTRDVNLDGCIDVADLQLVAAHFGATSGNVSQPQVYFPIIALDSSNQAPPGIVPAVELTFTVNSTSDEPDSNIGNGICRTASLVCSLRAAIHEANAHAGPDSIVFNIPGVGVQTIQLTNRLPALNDATGPTTIDGYSQPGATPNTDALVSNAAIKVQIEGGGENNFDGFTIISAGNVIRGLAIYRVQRAFWIKGSGASNNTITGSFIGTNAGGTYSATVGGNYSHGLHVELGASSNHVGGLAASERNVISGNGAHGLGIWHEQSDGNVVMNNLIGLTPSGSGRLSNLKHGLDINYGSSSNIYQGNVVSGNNGTGIEVSHTSDTRDNQIIGNLIGTDATGTSAPASFNNRITGITIEDGASSNVFADNVIGNNSAGGMVIDFGRAPTSNDIHNNRVGISLNGSPIPNGNYGISINGQGNLIGPGNIVAFNTLAGISIIGDSSDFNTLTRNSVYNNGTLGIDLIPVGVNPNDPGDVDTGPNEQLNFPILEAATPLQVSGTACAGCTVEIFVADSGASAYGEGKVFVGSATANSSGAFTTDISGAVPGDYVTSTATDSAGNTSEFSLNFLIPIPPNTTFAQDSFSRSVADGWGNADVGGAYTLSDAAADFAVNGSGATVTIPAANQTRLALLDATAAQDVDIVFRVQTDKLASGVSEHAYFIGRHVSPSTEYRGQIRFDPKRNIFVRAVRINNGISTALGSDTKVVGVTHAANTYIWVHAQIVGTNPTTIRIKAWADGQAEPATWQYSVTDATASLQTAGTLGLAANLPISTTNAPVVFTFDDYLVTSPGTP